MYFCTVQNIRSLWFRHLAHRRGIGSDLQITCWTGHVTPLKLLSLDINVSEAMELPVVWLLSTSLSLVWEARQSGKTMKFGAFKSELLDRMALLKKTKWKHFTLQNSGLFLDEMVNVHLN